MAKPKTKKPDSEPDTPEQAPAEDPAALDEVTSTTLTSEDLGFLQRVSTFLFHIPAYAARAKAHGYDDEEHELGKKLWSKAAGRDRPLSHWISEGAHAGQAAQYTAEQRLLLTEIDTFENAWFPRVRGILQRAVPDDHKEAFLAAFFQNLKQQPFGPLVLDSVSTLLDRFEDLAKSAAPGAKEAHALGVKRGLTRPKIAEVRGRIEAARKAMPPAVTSAPVGAKDLIKAANEQRAALADLRRWYNDWAATFRTVFGPRVQITLGITSIKRRGAEEPEIEAEPEGAPAPDAAKTPPVR